MPKCHPDHAPGHNKVFKIIVNGRQKEVTDRKLTYQEVIQLAFPGTTPDPNSVYTIAYANPHGKDGTLVEGQEVKIKNDMVFNVTQTNRS